MKFEDVKIGTVVYRVEEPLDHSSQITAVTADAVEIDEAFIMLDRLLLRLQVEKHVHATPREALLAFQETHRRMAEVDERSLARHRRLMTIADAQLGALGE